MACILHIETSTNVCSVAVSEDSHVIFQQENHGEHAAGAEHLGTMIDEALSFTDNHAIPFDAVSVSSGPGSYTGLRIGVSMAKGLCCGRDLRLIAVPTLELLCVPVLLRELIPSPTPHHPSPPTPHPAPSLRPIPGPRRTEVCAAPHDRILASPVSHAACCSLILLFPYFKGKSEK